MRVYLGSDHAGYELKQAIVEHLESSGHEPVDCGALAYDAQVLALDEPSLGLAPLIAVSSTCGSKARTTGAATEARARSHGPSVTTADCSRP